MIFSLYLHAEEICPSYSSTSEDTKELKQNYFEYISQIEFNLLFF
jgi:hypothetical protein